MTFVITLLLYYLIWPRRIKLDNLVLDQRPNLEVGGRNWDKMGKLERYWEAQEHTRITGKSCRRREDILGQMSSSGEKTDGLAEHPNQSVGEGQCKQEAAHSRPWKQTVAFVFQNSFHCNFWKGYHSSLHCPFFL